MRITKQFIISSLIVFITLCCYAPSLFAARLTTSVDRTSIVQGERFNLIISIHGRDLMGSPDLSSLQKNFELLGTSRNQSIVMINGNISRKNQWIITLIANKSGKQTIPAVKFGGLTTRPVTITVVTPGQTIVGRRQRQPLFLKAEVDTKTPLVQSELIYTLRLYYNVSIAGAVITPPNVKNAIIKEVGRGKRYQGRLNGRPMNVYQRQYAIFPQTSGELTIQSPVFSGSIRAVASNNAANQSFFGFNSQLRIQPVRLMALPITINVRQRPVTATGSWWLPARNIRLSQSWSHDLQQLRLGQPLTRTITIEASGLTAAQLPPLNTSETSSIKSYPGEPQLSDRFQNNKVIATRTEKIVYIPSASGDITLPAINISWWNTKTNRAETATLPAQQMHIIPGPTAPSTQTQKQAQVQDQIQHVGWADLAKPNNKRQEKASDRLGLVNLAQPTYWFWIILFLIFGWLSTLLFLWRQRRTKHSKHQESLKNRDPSKRQRLGAIKKRL